MSDIIRELMCNKPRKTPSHKTKSHVVKACKSGKERIIRFGQQGVKGLARIRKVRKIRPARKATTPVTMRRMLTPISSRLATGAIKSNGEKGLPCQSKL